MSVKTRAEKSAKKVRRVTEIYVANDLRNNKHCTNCFITPTNSK